eukprot:gene2796-1781_t
MQTINKHPVNVNPNARLHNTQQSNQPNLPTCKTVWNLHQINSRHQKFSSHKISPTQSVYHETSAPYVLHQQTLKTHVDSLLVPGSNLPRSLNHLQQTSLFKVARARVTANPQPKASTTRPTITTLHSIKAHKNQETHKNTLTARNPNNGPTATIGKPTSRLRYNQAISPENLHNPKLQANATRIKNPHKQYHSPLQKSSTYDSTVNTCTPESAHTYIYGSTPTHNFATSTVKFPKTYQPTPTPTSVTQKNLPQNAPTTVSKFTTKPLFPSSPNSNNSPTFQSHNSKNPPQTSSTGKPTTNNQTHPAETNTNAKYAPIMHLRNTKQAANLLTKTVKTSKSTTQHHKQPPQIPLRDLLTRSLPEPNTTKVTPTNLNKHSEKHTHAKRTEQSTRLELCSVTLKQEDPALKPQISPAHDIHNTPKHLVSPTSFPHKHTKEPTNQSLSNKLWNTSHPAKLNQKALAAGCQANLETPNPAICHKHPNSKYPKPHLLKGPSSQTQNQRQRDIHGVAHDVVMHCGSRKQRKSTFPQSKRPQKHSSSPLSIQDTLNYNAYIAQSAAKKQNKQTQQTAQTTWKVVNQANNNACHKYKQNTHLQQQPNATYTRKQRKPKSAL